MGTLPDLPDLTKHGYQVTDEFDQDDKGMWRSYRASRLKTKRPVIIKLIPLQRDDDLAAYKPQIQALLKLKHPGIARYIHAFRIAEGLCLVRQYIEGAILDGMEWDDPKQIRAIAINLMETLVFLQAQQPTIFHLNIKPANIIVGMELKTYLLDFALTTGKSSGTKPSAFAAPEIKRRRPPKPNTDLYGVGLALVCLITGTTGDRVSELFDATGGLRFRRSINGEISDHFLDWLDKMTNRLNSDRYADPSVALEALQEIDFERKPELKIEPEFIQLKAKNIGDLLRSNIIVSNTVADTLLEGRWEVMPHRSDPNQASGHAWIRFEPPSFAENRTVCQVCVDTNKIVAGKTYRRTLMLHANSAAETHTVELEVKTAPLPSLTIPYQKLAILIVLATVGSFLVTSAIHALTPLVPVPENFNEAIAYFGSLDKFPPNVDLAMLKDIIQEENSTQIYSAWGGLLIGLGSGVAAGAYAESSDIYAVRNSFGAAAIASISLRLIRMFVRLFWAIAMVGIIVGLVLGIVVGYLSASSHKEHLKLGFPKGFAFAVPALAAIFSLTTGIAFKLSFTEDYIQLPWLPWLAAISAIGLVGTAGMHILRQKTFLENYQRRSRRLIKP
ncbi:serine/threonine protein kinase [Thalassoporum mexicanum PCC 7367]|uniref:serine/threonine protein kinase n=1 Tax=Thalassoporum mexicanum TaxID=3457544 RepID=UPI00029FA88F|nr:protein kinase [Pseudanabaena sp. PCC 7367]AFY71188.1 serine/threonine protein kinase [Pseudanabaena sp. PCC 7367]